METFITTVCTNDLGTPEVITCEYGGVLPYIPIILTIGIIFGSFYLYTVYLMRKIL